MTERDEQGFVKDINVAINDISNENKTPKEKIKDLIELPFTDEQVPEVVEFIKQNVADEVDFRDIQELVYPIALNNLKYEDFDEMFRSKLEERHKELVEALMNRLEGVFKMYDENLENVTTVNPVVEQPVDVQAPQLDVVNPEPPVEAMEVGVQEPIATFEAPVMADPTAYVDPTAYGEVPAMEPAAFNPEMAVPTMEPAMVDPTAYAEPVVEAPVMAEPVAEIPAMEEPVMEVPVAEPVAVEPAVEVPAVEPVAVEPAVEVPVEEPVVEAVETPEVNDFENFINGLTEVTGYEEPVQEPEVNDFEEFVNNMPETDYEEPVQEPEVNDFEDFVNNLPETDYEEPVPEMATENELTEEDKEDNFESPEPQELFNEKEDLVAETDDDNHTPDDDEDEEVKEIINRYDRLKELEINVHNNQKRLVELQNEVDAVQLNIENDKEEIKKLVA